MDLLFESAVCSAALGLNCVLFARSRLESQLLNVARFAFAVLLSGITFGIALFDNFTAQQFEYWRPWLNQPAVFIPLVAVVLFLLFANAVAMISTLFSICLHRPRTFDIVLDLSAAFLPIYLFLQVVFAA